jgi:hypothetical protein
VTTSAGTLPRIQLMVPSPSILSITHPYWASCIMDGWRLGLAPAGAGSRQGKGKCLVLLSIVHVVRCTRRLPPTFVPTNPRLVGAQSTGKSAP